MAKPTRCLMQATKGAVSSPHYLASLAGLRVLQDGGNAIDAAIAVNSTLGVVYPHMTGMGGDAFWLIYDATEKQVRALNGSGRSAKNATREFFRKLGYDKIPERGPLAAVTVPGAVDSWCTAHERYGRLSLRACLKPAITYAGGGFPVSEGQHQFTRERRDVLSQHQATRETFLPHGEVPRPGSVMRLPQLAETMAVVADQGRSGFYSGAVAEEMVRALGSAGGFWEMGDLAGEHATWENPVSTTYRGYTALQHPPNCQGFVHLMMLNVLENFDVPSMGHTSAEFIHLFVEACKIIFQDRDRYLTDPTFSDIPLDELLSKSYAAEIAQRIRAGEPTSDVRPAMGGDTTATVVVDGDGNAVSMIQSLYHEFGSAVVAGKTGILLQNRGSFFSLDETEANRLEPGKRCFHTLMPGMLMKDDELHLVYGTMGGEGQPQTSTMVVTRVVDFAFDVQRAIDQPRWLYGRTWGEETKNLRLESRFDPQVIATLTDRGHPAVEVDPWSDVMGHAAAIQRDPESGVLSAGADRRGEGIAVGW
jgi:gamma-glutamyltranspeptidase